MGEWFTAWILDVLRGWVGSSERGDPVRMTTEQIVAYHEMQNRHSDEEQAFLRGIIRGGSPQAPPDVG